MHTSHGFNTDKTLHIFNFQFFRCFIEELLLNGISLGRNWEKNTHNIDFLPLVFWNVVAIQALAFSTDCGDVPL